ncbi:MAG: hypothetical protein GXX96_19605 [Planctomycetaceae bacterium]|nr:hypothetical protein [Planctomycetaceae bacterium]
MSRYRLLLGLVAAAMLISGVRAADYRCFDMGTDDSPLRDGFIRVTAKSAYSPEAGYGWRTLDGLKSHHRSYSREWEYSESRGREYPPAIYTNEVTCDTIFSKQANAFLVDVPPGDYTAYLFGGLSAGSARDYHWFDAAVGGARQTVKIDGPYRFEKCVFKTSVQQGPLAVELAPTTGWLATCLIVFPTSAEQQVRADLLDALEQEIYFLPPDVAAKWKKTEHEEPRPMPDFSAEDRDRGYAVFARHWSEVIYPNTAPRPQELDPKLAAFASLGEYEPVTLTVRPLADLADARLTAGDLRCGDAVIPAANIDVRWVRYMLVRPNYSMFFAYHVAPDVLEHRESADLKAGENQRFWITTRVPDDATAGVYEGKLTFQAKGRPAAEIALKLRVLPIRLQKNPEHVYGMYYRDPLSNVDDGNSPEANAYFARKAELERLDMVEHGMTTHISGVTGLDRDEQGNWTMDGAETERRIALSRKFGLADQPLVVSIPVGWWYSRLVDKKGTGSHLRLMRDDVPQSFYDEVTKMVEAVQKERKNYDWPEFLYYPIDEPSTSPSSVKFMVGVMKAIKQVPGVRTYVTADPSHEQFEPMWPYVDVWCCQPFVFGYEKIRRLSRERGIEFWCYPNHISGENDHTPIRGARMTWGYGFWKSGFKTLIPWIYQSSSGDPWNYLDGSSMDFFNRSTPEGEPIPVAMWEAYREGIDDGRYLYTLGQLVERGKKAGGPQADLARQAEAEIRYLWDAVDVQEKYKYDDLWSGPDFDAYRWLLARWILRLQGPLP